ncbi:GTP pyrophosphokinase [Streptococcus uberis]
MITNQAERLISEINHSHTIISKDYFENLNIKEIEPHNAYVDQIFNGIKIQPILDYRLNLHESINDYLMTADLKGIDYVYRVKTSESIINKINQYSSKDKRLLVKEVLDDILGMRILLNAEEIIEVLNSLDNWKEEYGLKNWYLRDKDGYKGLHLYFKNDSYYPWELQIWDSNDVTSNIKNRKERGKEFYTNPGWLGKRAQMLLYTL